MLTIDDGIRQEVYELLQAFREVVRHVQIFFPNVLEPIRKKLNKMLLVFRP